MKIIVSHVPAGSGHEKAAEAISGALRRIRPDADVSVLNALEGMNPAYQWAFTDGYLDIIHKYPALWGLAYHSLDIKMLSGLAFWLHRTSNAMHGKSLETILLREKPDVFIGTHFFPMEVASSMKQEGKLDAKLITVITDYMPHNVWIAPRIDAYAAGMELTKKELMSRGIPEKKIYVTGIPIDSKFGKKLPRQTVAANLGLDPAQFTLLVVSGGYGTGPVAELVKALGRIKEPMQVIVVCGKNTALRKKLTLLQGFPHKLIVYGFVDNMDELMDAADLLVTKPGGLSCTEAMAKGLPMVLVAPIPGQEARNAVIIERSGAAVLAGPIQKAPPIIEKLRSDPAQLAEMGRKGMASGKPDAAIEIARLALI